MSTFGYWKSCKWGQWRPCVFVCICMHNMEDRLQKSWVSVRVIVGMTQMQFFFLLLLHWQQEERVAWITLYITEHHLGQMMKNPCLCQLLSSCWEFVLSPSFLILHKLFSKYNRRILFPARKTREFVMLTLPPSRTLKRSTYPPCLALTEMSKKVVLQVPVHFPNMFCTYVFIYYAFITI